MSPTLGFILALLFVSTGFKVDTKIDKDAVKRMQEREEFLHQEMTWLLQEIDDNSSVMESLFLSVQQLLWLPWLTKAVLLSLAFWLVRRWERGSASHSMVRVKQGMPSAKVLQEVVDELLGVCRVLSRMNFVPELHPATGMDTSPAACSVQENSSTYRTLVILRPPPGHSFSLESTKWSPARRIRVVLECLCSGEKLRGHTCFLHASGGQLLRDEEWYLMDTLCTGSYLDPKKVSRWVQRLVVSAWLLLPYSCHCQLTALSSGKSCRFRLSSTSGLHCIIEMALAVQQGSSGAYLSLE
uniref:Inositol 1,4,5-trisphosphate receptor-interacting protein-like 1 n=1 Tax=Taeniopygia guttata TaxID=59729 RepID=A0A674GN27_TAEGU